MFNFLFDGKIGDILAPIQSPIQQFHLAIQHHRNNEVEQIILSGTIELGNISNSGYADIHVACRYNNIHVLHILLRRGIPVTHLDKYGNTPLHYAAKYGNIEICRILIESSASPAIRNTQGESAYDMSDNHIIRQYLLPLQLACEREMNPTNSNIIQPPPPPLGSGYLPNVQPTIYPPPNNSISPGIPIYSPPNVNIGSNYIVPPLPTPVVNAPPSPNSRHDVNYISSNSSTPSQVANSTSPSSISSANIARPTVFVNTSTTLPGVITNANTNNNNNSPILNDSIQSQQFSHSTSSNELQENSSTFPPPPPSGVGISTTSQWNPPGIISSAPSSGGSNNTAANSRRIIQPDGFESSASSIALKEKYGHTKIVNAVAPPPIFNSYAPPPPSSSSSVSSVGVAGTVQPPPPVVYSSVGNNGNNLAPPNIYQPPISNSTPSYLQNRYVPYDPNTPPIPYGQPNQNSYIPSAPYQQPPTPNNFQYPSPIQVPADNNNNNNTYSIPPNPIPQQFQPPSITTTSSTSSTSSTNELTSNINIPTTRLNSSPRIHVNADNVIFNPSTDRVVSATSSSSAIL